MKQVNAEVMELSRIICNRCDHKEYKKCRNCRVYLLTKRARARAQFDITKWCLSK